MRVRCSVAAMVLAAILPTSGAAQTWVRNYGTEFHAIQPTPDGGSIAAGDISMAGWSGSVVKLDADGLVQWRVKLTGGDSTYLEDVAVLPDGYACVGAFYYDSFTCAPWIVKLDLAGNLAWQWTLRGPNGEFGESRQVVGTAAGSIVMTLEVRVADVGDADHAVLSLSSAGDLQWARLYRRTLGMGCGGANFQGGLLALPDNSIVAGTSIEESCAAQSPNWDNLLLRFAADGTLISQRAFGAPFGAGEFLTSLASRGDGGFLVTSACWNQSRPGGPTERNAVVASLDPSGSITWARELGDVGPNESLLTIVASPAGQCIAAGRVQTGPDVVGSILTISAVGDLMEQHGFTDKWFNAACRDESGGLLTAGGGIVARLDARGSARSTCLNEVTTAISLIDHPVREWDPARPVDAATFTFVPDTVVWSRDTTASSCASLPCIPLGCGAISTLPAAPCSGRDIVLELDATGGEFPSVSWDVDGDGVPEATGNPAVLRLTAGSWHVVATANDICPSGAQTCSSATDIIVNDLSPPGEVSNVLAGAVPLEVRDHGDNVLAEALPDATSYHLYAGFIGSWVPAVAAGTACGATTLIDVPGHVRLTPILPVDTWIIVTGANSCGEGPTGNTSLGAARDAAAGWQHCP